MPSTSLMMRSPFSEARRRCRALPSIKHSLPPELHRFRKVCAGVMSAWAPTGQHQTMISIWEEIDTAAKLHKLISEDPTTLLCP